MVEKRGEIYDPYYDWVLKKLGKTIPKSAYCDGYVGNIKNNENE